MTRKALAWTTALGVVLVVAAALGLLVFRYRGRPNAPPAMVPASWAQYRTSVGHAMHVDSAKVTCSGCHDFERKGFKNPGVFEPVSVQHLNNGDFLIANGASSGDVLQPQLGGATNPTSTGNVFAIAPTVAKDIDPSVPVYGREIPGFLSGPNNSGALSIPSSASQLQ